MKKNVIIAICVFLAIVFLLPIPLKLKDGGTVEYTAILYKVSRVHSIDSTEEIENGKMYKKGIIIEILGLEIFNNVK